MSSVMLTNVEPAAIDDLKHTATHLHVPPGVVVTRLLDLYHALSFAAATSADADLRDLAATLLRTHHLGT